MAVCLKCGGSKHIFINVRLKMYAEGSLTRIYVGKCTTCDPTGQVELKPDRKQLAAAESRHD